ncbi:MAG: hypothetical protein HY855_10205 [Burkholderiales bacterium]|nr:hypothetical protein [Burkholderiales bacterium]
MTLLTPSPLLKTALLIDAAMSAAMAALQLAATAPLGHSLQLPTLLLQESGLFMLAYAVLLVFMARAARLPSALVGLVVWGNLGWALGCALLAGSTWLQPSVAGLGFLAVHAAGVLAMAALEFAGWRRSTPVRALAA